MAADRFELENAIMNAWNTADDIELLADAVLNDELTTDEIANALIGLKQLHSLRAKKTFDIFEELTESGDIQ